MQGRKLPPLPSLPRSRLLFSSSSPPTTGTEPAVPSRRANFARLVLGPASGSRLVSATDGFGLFAWPGLSEPSGFDSASQRLLSLSLSVSQSVSALCVCSLMRCGWSISRCIVSPFNLSLSLSLSVSHSWAWATSSKEKSVPGCLCENPSHTQA